MTLLPVEAKRISKLPPGSGTSKFPPASGQQCSNPLCVSTAFDRHHIVRRSYAGGMDWVMIDGIITPNIAYLCRPCHDLVSHNKARVVYLKGEFFWSEGPNVMRLDPYPDERPTIGEQPDKPEVFSEPPAFPGETVCPTCERPLPKPKEKREEARERRSWTITVPKDEREDGAERLDVLLEEARLEMGRRGLPYGEANSVRYFVLSTALALFVTHADQLINE